MIEPVWLAWPVGAKVTIRRRLAEGGFADTVGLLEAASAEFVAVRHRSGELRRIEADSIAIAHLVERPPDPAH
ncbi:MAG: hypothetical protein LBS27_10815 [Bifidobacteriaceae bacterium]|nr:hypothetical protein [Bifidobacteriaceae bacterium]